VQLRHNIHLAYCTNIHRGQNWTQTFDALVQYTLAVRDRVSRQKPYAIGLRLSNQAALELSDRTTLTKFQQWLDKENCYIFTINGFPYGTFHGGRVKELAYVPDWTTPERVEYTNRLFNLLSKLVPPGVEGSVSTVPCSFKPLIQTQEQVQQMRDNLWQSIEHIAQISEKSGRMLHLGLEPEPRCFLETSTETLTFIEGMRAERPKDERIIKHLGVNYDCCHFAVEYEEPATALRRFTSNGIRVSKLHFSSALKVEPTTEARAALKSFVDPVYFHQVIARLPGRKTEGLDSGGLTAYLDLDEALKAGNQAEEEWRIHYHVPLHCRPSPPFDTTSDHLIGVMDLLRDNPKLCSHIEMETYTWEVLPPALKERSVVDQLVAEYEWTLNQMAARGLA
jgi:hypothetical protein